MSCPPGVPEPDRPVDRPILDQLGQASYPAGALPDLQRTIRDQRDAGGIVSPVLQPAEAVKQDWCRIGLPHVTNDSAHIRKGT